MNPAVRQPPRARPLEANAIDHLVRCYGGQTIAIEMEPRHMQKSKQPRDVVQYIDFLNRRNGELRLELTFYRECYHSFVSYMQGRENNGELIISESCGQSLGSHRPGRTEECRYFRCVYITRTYFATPNRQRACMHIAKD